MRTGRRRGARGDATQDEGGIGRPPAPLSNTAMQALARAGLPPAADPGSLQRALRPAVQRKTLAATGWLPNLDEAGVKRSLVGSEAWPVNSYAEEAPAVANRTAALRAAAARNAHVGKTVDQKAQADFRLDTNRKWTPRLDQLETDNPTIDPFFYAVAVPFGPPNGKKERVEFTFQHSKEMTGYVESVHDTTNPATKSVPSMYVAGVGAANTGTTGTFNATTGSYTNNKFTNVHEYEKGRDAWTGPANNANVLTQSGGGTATAFDAYTKIVGEGARWQCVAAHAANLTNNSVFFTDHPRDGRKVRGVTFRTLWLSWKDVFGKRYDIPDSEVKAAIDRGLFQFSGRATTVDLWNNEISGADYDLG